MTIKPSLQVGAALDLSDDLTISGDLHNRFSDGGIAFTPKFHLGAGAEFRGLKVIHLRGGAAIITDGIQSQWRTQPRSRSGESLRGCSSADW